MNPSKGSFSIPSLGKSSDVSPGKLKALTQMFNGKKVAFKQKEEKLIIIMPAVNGNSLPVVLKAKFK